jgi:hypothetical protein
MRHKCSGGKKSPGQMLDWEKIIVMCPEAREKKFSENQTPVRTGNILPPRLSADSIFVSV